jgi:hypothetical protein
MQPWIHPAICVMALGVHLPSCSQAWRLSHSESRVHGDVLSFDRSRRGKCNTAKQSFLAQAAALDTATLPRAPGARHLRCCQRSSVNVERSYWLIVRSMSQERQENDEFIAASVPITAGNALDLVACRTCSLVKAAVQVPSEPPDC